MQRVETMDKQINHHKSVNEKLAHEIALLKRLPTQRSSETSELLPHKWARI